MGSDSTELQLAEWRRPIQWGNTIQLVLIIAPVFGLFIAAALRKGLGIELPWNLVLGIGMALLGSGGILLGDHRRMPAGSLRLEPGKLLFTGWGRGTWDVSTDRLTIIDGNSDVLVLHFRDAPPIRLHQARLSVPLSEVRAAILQHAGLRLADSSRATVVRAMVRVYAARLRQSLPVLFVILAILGLARWWLIP